MPTLPNIVFLDKTKPELLSAFGHKIAKASHKVPLQPLVITLDDLLKHTTRGILIDAWVLVYAVQMREGPGALRQQNAALAVTWARAGMKPEAKCLRCKEENLECYRPDRECARYVISQLCSNAIRSGIVLTSTSHSHRL